MLCCFLCKVWQRRAEILQSHLWRFWHVSVRCWKHLGSHLCQCRATSGLWVTPHTVFCPFHCWKESNIVIRKCRCVIRCIICYKLHFEWLFNVLFAACAPTFIYNPVKKILLGAENGRVVIECKPRAAPKPRFIWKRGSELFSNSSRSVSFIFTSMIQLYKEDCGLCLYWWSQFIASVELYFV